jgi:hypothetical protein
MRIEKRGRTDLIFDLTPKNISEFNSLGSTFVGYFLRSVVEPVQCTTMGKKMSQWLNVSLLEPINPE